jgi:hypothetical protein
MKKQNICEENKELCNVIYISKFNNQETRIGIGKLLGEF